MQDVDAPDACAPATAQPASPARPVAGSVEGNGDLGPQTPGPMRLIEAAELKAKLDRGDDFRLVNALGEWEFRAKHIPGSLHFATAGDAFLGLDPADEIVVYCSNPLCRASIYRNLRRFAGGVAAWEDAGYPLEGEWMHTG